MAAELLLSCVATDGDGYAALLDSGAGVGAMDGKTVSVSGAVQLEADGMRVSAEDAEGVAASWSAQGGRLEIESDELRVAATPVTAAVEGDFELDGEGILWELDVPSATALRTVWARFEDGGLLVLILIRPEGADGHGDEQAVCVRQPPEGDAFGYEAPLLSTEYDPAGAQRRATLELWPTRDEGLPDRGGGVRSGGGAARAGEQRLEAARFEWRLDGTPGVGGYEILTR
jgi:hypothetical protein